MQIAPKWHSADCEGERGYNKLATGTMAHCRTDQTNQQSNAKAKAVTRPTEGERAHQAAPMENLEP